MADKTLKYFRGWARIGLAALKFDHPRWEGVHREHSADNVQRLIKIYELEGCKPLEEKHHISALVSAEILQQALTASGVAAADLLNQRALPLLFVSSVDCLTGLHRIAAARQHLEGDDRWWVVKLYSDDLPELAVTAFLEECHNEKRPGGGEILRKIRLYHRASDTREESKWWALLTSSIRCDFRRLLRTSRFASAFDRLIDFPGLWQDVDAGIIQRVLALKCEEELLHYLDHVANFWHSLLDGFARSLADSETVRCLQCLAPRESAADLRQVEFSMLSKTIFGAVTIEAQRATLLQRIKNTTGFIPSLWSFFENTKFLEPCCSILKQVLRPPRKRSLRRTFFAGFSHPTRLVIAYSDNDRRTIRATTESDDRWLAYLQLWLFTMRWWPHMTHLNPRRDSGKARHEYKLNQYLWNRLATFAVELGFRKEHLLQMQSDDPEEVLARQCLEQAGYSTLTSGGEIISSIALILKRASTQYHEHVVTITGDYDHLPDPGRRSGRPFDEDFTKERSLLFLPYLNARSTGPHLRPTSFHSNMLRSYFGTVTQFNLERPVTARTSARQSRGSDAAPAANDDVRGENTHSSHDDIITEIAAQYQNLLSPTASSEPEPASPPGDPADQAITIRVLSCWELWNHLRRTTPSQCVLVHIVDLQNGFAVYNYDRYPYLLRPVTERLVSRPDMEDCDLFIGEGIRIITEFGADPTNELVRDWLNHSILWFIKRANAPGIKRELEIYRSRKRQAESDGANDGPGVKIVRLGT